MNSQQSGAASAEAPSDRQRAVRAAVDYTRVEIDRLLNLVEALESRLGDVMGAAPPEALNKEPPQVDTMGVVVAEQVFSGGIQVTGLCFRVANILERLEV